MTATRTPAQGHRGSALIKTATVQRGSGRRQYGASWEIELDSLADRLLTDTGLRQAITAANGAKGPIAAARPSWADRVARLAKDQGEPWSAQLETIANRAIEMTQGDAR